MTQGGRIMTIGAVLLSIFAGCTAAPSGRIGGPEAPASAPATTQQDKAALLFHYRQEAADLREMAKRREMEADVLARNPGADPEQVRRKRDLAQDLRTAADEAEQKAQELRRQVPHGMVQ
jgi:hypothetical protein